MIALETIRMTALSLELGETDSQNSSMRDPFCVTFGDSSQNLIQQTTGHLTFHSPDCMHCSSMMRLLDFIQVKLSPSYFPLCQG